LKSSHDLQSTYETMSPGYDRDRENAYFAIVEEIERRTLRRVARDEVRRVLDLGVGTGRLAGTLAADGRKVIGTDLTLAMLTKARMKNEVSAVVNADAVRLPFQSGSFDLVYSFKVFPHIPDQPSAVAEVKRVLRVEGVAIIEFYNPYSLRRIVSRTNYFTKWQNEAEARRLLEEAGFEVLHVIGARALIPVAWLCNWRPLASLFRKAELWASETLLRRFAGYQIFVARFRSDLGA